MMIQSGSIQWSLCNLIRYTVLVGLAVGQRDDRTKRLIKVLSTGEEVQNFLALETSEGFSQGLNCEHPTRQIRAVSYHPHIRTLFSYQWLANLEGCRVSLVKGELLKKISSFQ